LSVQCERIPHYYNIIKYLAHRLVSKDDSTSSDVILSPSRVCL